MQKGKLATVLLTCLMIIGLFGCLASVFGTTLYQVTLASDGNGQISSRDVYDNNNIYTTYSSLTVYLPNVKTQFQDIPNSGYQFDHFTISGTGMDDVLVYSQVISFFITGNFTITAHNVIATPTPTPANPETITAVINPAIAGLGIFITDMTTGYSTPAITGSGGTYTFNQGDSMMVSPYSANESYEFANYTVTDGGSLDGTYINVGFAFTLTNDLTLTTYFNYILGFGGKAVLLQVYGYGEIDYVSNNSHNQMDGALTFVSTGNVTLDALPQNKTLALSPGQTETFTAFPLPNFMFDYWNITGDVAPNGTQTGGSVSIPITANFTIAAYFKTSTTSLSYYLTPAAWPNSNDIWIAVWQGTSYTYTGQILLNGIAYTGGGTFSLYATSLSTYQYIASTNPDGTSSWPSTPVLSNIPIVNGKVQFDITPVSRYSTIMYQGIDISMNLGNGTSNLYHVYTIVWNPPSASTGPSGGGGLDFGAGAFNVYIQLLIGAIFTFLGILVFMKASSAWIVGTIVLVVGFLMMVFSFPNIYGLFTFAFECIVCTVFLYQSSSRNKGGK